MLSKTSLWSGVSVGFLSNWALGGDSSEKPTGTLPPLVECRGEATKPGAGISVKFKYLVHSCEISGFPLTEAHVVRDFWEGSFEFS
jgi:hypothetical protein